MFGPAPPNRALAQLLVSQLGVCWHATGGDRSPRRAPVILQRDECEVDAARLLVARERLPSRTVIYKLIDH